jgi:hypothetical protein
VNFCQSKFSIDDNASLIQTEHTFDIIPFAEIATQQCDRIPAIQQILLTGKNFVRETKKPKLKIS